VIAAGTDDALARFAGLFRLREGPQDDTALPFLRASLDRFTAQVIDKIVAEQDSMITDDRPSILTKGPIAQIEHR
jgi:hypothetical protein